MESIRELQRVADFVILRTELRRSAMWSVFCGLLAVGMGIASHERGRLLDYLPIMIGGLLVLEGMKTITEPQAVSLLTEGMGFVAMGLWNITFPFINGIKVCGIWTVPIGLVEFLWGIQWVLRYRRVSGLSMGHLPPRAADQMTDLLADIRKANPNTCSQIITLMSVSLLDFSPKNWKGLLMEDRAILVDFNNKEALIVTKDEVTITPVRKELFGRRLIAGLTVKGRKMEGRIAPVCLQRYEAWKSSANQGPFSGMPDLWRYRPVSRM